MVPSLCSSLRKANPSQPNKTSLLELLLKHGYEVLGDLEGLTGDLDCGDSLGFGAVGAEVRDPLLDSNVVGILAEEVGHGVAEELVAGRVGDLGVRGVATAAVGLDADLLAGLGLDGELDLVEVGETLSAGALEGLHGGELLVGSDGLDVVDGDIVEGNEEGELVNGHVLEHSLAVALEALSEGLGGRLVG